MKIQLAEHFTCSKLIRFTIPTIIMMIFISIYGVVDGIFISNFVGSDEFAAANIIYPVIMILGCMGFMVGTGGSALVSKTLGEGDKENANKYFSMLIYALIIAAIILSVVGIILMEPIAKMLKADGNMFAPAVTYGKVMLMFLVPFVLQGCFQNFLVAAEKPTFGLVITILAGITNMILDYIFMAVLDMGVLGAAIATGISEAVGGLIPFTYFLFKNDSPLRLVKTKIDMKIILKACGNGASEMLSNVSFSIINILFNLQLMKYAGANGVVAYGIIMYVGFIVIATYLGYSIGVAPVISYHFGAKNHKELKGLLKKSVGIITVMSVVMTVLIEIFSKHLAAIFVGYDIDLLNLTTRAIRIFSLSYLLAGFNIFASSFFTALNDGKISAIISVFRTLIFQILMILILPTIWKIDGLWASVIFAELLAVILSVYFTLKNRKEYKYL